MPRIDGPARAELREICMQDPGAEYEKRAKTAGIRKSPPMHSGRTGSLRYTSQVAPDRSRSSTHRILDVALISSTCRSTARS